MKKLDEISTNRILKHLTDDSNCAIISAYRTERTEAENRKLLQKLKADARKLKLGFTEFVSRWVEVDDKTREAMSSDERSLMIYGISLEAAIDFGKEYGQSSIIFKTKERCAEVCTNEFVSYDGKKFSVGQLVRKFNLSSAASLNLSQAEEIFKNRAGGPASKAVKSNRAFTLKEVLEVEGPKASVFAVTEKFRN